MMDEMKSVDNMQDYGSSSVIAEEQPMTAAECFRHEFLQEVKVTSQESGEGSTRAFVDKMVDYLREAEVIFEAEACFFSERVGRSNCRVDGYYYDEADKVMTLFIADYEGLDDERRLTSTTAQKRFDMLASFAKAALGGKLDNRVEKSQPIADLIDVFHCHKHDIRKYVFILLTDAKISLNQTTPKSDEIGSLPTELEIWDIERIYKVCASDKGREPIAVDFCQYTQDGLDCICANVASIGKYTSYLAVIRGDVLCAIYDQYGARLLESNVRSFLTTKVAVNKNIRNTILNAPEMFFAYNNGISVTARGVEVDATPDGLKLRFARDFQIINGGQTTASLSHARHREGNRVDLSKIFVQMKLTAIDDTVSNEEHDKLVMDISRSSNSQNKVSDADFFASHPFHRNFEQLSLQVYAPAKLVGACDTQWFYERARGQYIQAQARMSPAKKREFERIHPKKQVIKKTDVSKVHNTWRGNPHIVSKGAQTNFAKFATYIDEEWKRDETQFNKLYFQKTVALIIMFQCVEREVSMQSWYRGGYRANIVCYTIALLHHLIVAQYKKLEFDFNVIWKMQSVPEALRCILVDLSRCVFDVLTGGNDHVQNVTQWCKQEACWSQVNKISYSLPESIKQFLVDKDEAQSAKKSARREQKIELGINAQMSLMNYKSNYWQSLREFAKRERIFMPNDEKYISLIENASITRQPNEVQCMQLLKLIERAKENGWVEPASV